MGGVYKTNKHAAADIWTQTQNPQIQGSKYLSLAATNFAKEFQGWAESKSEFLADVQEIVSPWGLQADESEEQAVW